ncbi:MAG: LysR family hydrogen peroxide-inducible transcriptional activator [Nitrospinales bacterium]|jgi:LysR family hydrogen peroxide-inducible transcriptional activator
MQIQKLEDDLGVTLFDRSKKPVEPTAMGKKIIAQAQIVIQEANRIEELIKEEKGEISGEFRLGIIPTLAPYLLPLFLKNFTTTYPAVSLIVEEMQTQKIIKMLKEDKIDAGILVTPLNQKGVVEWPIFNDPFLAYLAPKHPLLSLSQVSDKDLSQDDIWLLNEGHCFRDQAIEICKRVKGKGSKNKNLTFESGNLETLKRLVDQNFGYTLLPSLAILGMSASEQKKKVRFFKSPAPIREVSVVYSRNYLKKSIIEALYKEVVSSLPKELKKSKTKERLIEISPSKSAI